MAETDIIVTVPDRTDGRPTEIPQIVPAVAPAPMYPNGGLPVVKRIPAVSSGSRGKDRDC